MEPFLVEPVLCQAAANFRNFLHFHNHIVAMDALVRATRVRTADSLWAMAYRVWNNIDRLSPAKIDRVVYLRLVDRVIIRRRSAATPAFNLHRVSGPLHFRERVFPFEYNRY